MMTRLSMGLSASSDQFNQQVGGVVDNFPNLSVVREIDDLLGHATSIDQLNKELELLFKICRQHSLTLSPKKFALATEDSYLIFAGHKISSRSCEPDPERMSAISEFPRPETRKQLQSLFGLVTQFHSWAPDVATATSHMRKLLLAKVSFQWSQECEEEFTALKKILTSPLFLRPFDSCLETTFSVDTSNLEGTGFLLSQEDKEGKTRVVRCGSVTAKKSWKSLSPIESEAVGICWSAQALDYYLRGAPKVRCIIDHRPLQTLMTAPLESLSPRMLHARLELLPYRIEFIWVPRHRHQICDALGRRPVYQSWKNLPEPMSNLTEDPPIHNVISNVTGLDDYLGIEVTYKVKAAIKSDPNYQAILEKVGEVSRKEIGNLPRAHPARELQSIWGLCSKVTVGEGEESVQVILVDNTRLFVPTSERASVLSLLHQSHTGINRTTEAAKRLFFWRGMKEQIAKMISACDICIKYQPSKPQIEEVEKVSPSTHPLHRVCLDLFTYNSSQYSILMDEYSRYFWIQRFKGTPTTDQLTKYLGTLFLETGVPSYLHTDDGGSMRGRFEMWCNDLGVVVEKSSAFNPISNGTAERHVQVAKRMLDISKEQKIPVKES